MVSPPRCVVYYGETLPAAPAARRLTDATVILQPYHPLVRSGDFAAYFPHCRRFVYWNPTGLHVDALPTLRQRLALERWDPDWHLVRLDLHDEATREHVVRAALACLGGGVDVHGLFVDDLDLWAGGRRRRVATELLARVAATAGRDVDWVVNRGFAHWTALSRLHAVTLESLAPRDVDALPPGDATWVRQVVLPPVRRVRRAGVRVFGISYAPPAAAPFTGSLSAELAALTHATVHATPHLDEWPEELR